ncbi:MAG: nucleotidyltransferase domain-containing protein [Candidatus Micrarchaeota archaeon]|nr:nucleotidyltransferase domain-containing protein [Candidatus Micrarchaeota archaeon]
MLVVLPNDDVRRIEDEVHRGRYVTKSDFLRVAIRQLLDRERAAALEDKRIAEPAGIIDREEILRLLGSSKKTIREFGVRQIGLFGSYASGKNGPDSDIDILIEFEKGRKDFHSYMGLKHFLEDLFGRKVDLVIKDSVRPELRGSILGGVVYA